MGVQTTNAVSVQGQKTAWNLTVSRALAADARRVFRRTNELWRERLALPGPLSPRSYHSLTRHARMFPEFRRFLPMTGAALSDDLRVKIQERPEGMLAVVAGEVDLTNADQLRDTLDPAVHNCRNIIIDAKKISYIDSRGLHMLAGLARGLRQGNCQLVIVGATSSVTKVMEIFRLNTLASLVPTLEDAYKMLNREESPQA